MAIRRFAALAGVVFAALGLAACQENSAIPKDIRPVSHALVSRMEQLQMRGTSPILIRIFKEESALEIWKQRIDGQYWRALRRAAHRPLVHPRIGPVEPVELEPEAHPDGIALPEHRHDIGIGRAELVVAAEEVAHGGVFGDDDPVFGAGEPGMAGARLLEAGEGIGGSTGLSPDPAGALSRVEAKRLRRSLRPA